MFAIWLVLACSSKATQPGASPAPPPDGPEIPVAAPTSPEPPAGPQLVPLDAPSGPAPESVPALAPQPDPPPGTMAARLAWLETHAPLEIPPLGCAWLPPAPGCTRPAWVCTSTWIRPGTFGQDAIFGTDPAVLAQRRKRPTDQPMAPEPGEGESDVPVPVNDPELGPVFQLSLSYQISGAYTYTTCIRKWEETHAGACDAACTAQAAKHDFSAWKGHAAAETRCDDEANKASQPAEGRVCKVLLADACTGHVGLDCDGEKPRYATPSFVGEASP